MNSMHNDSQDELEKQLSSLSLVEPSDGYRNLAAALEELPKNPLPAREKSLLGYAMAFGFTFACLVGVGLVMRGEMPADKGQYISEGAAGDESSVVTVNAAQVPPFIVGTHYQDLGISGTTGTQPFSDIKVFFSYPCFPCFAFNEILGQWKREMSSAPQVVYVPAIWSEEMRYYAQVFYTAESLGIQESSHQLLFESLHEEELMLTELPILTGIFSLLGVSQQQFLAAFNSEETLNHVREAEQANLDYRIRSVPALVVDCRYLIAPNSEVGQREMLDVAQYLIDNRNEGGEKLC